MRVEIPKREQFTRWEDRSPTYTVHFWDRLPLPVGGLGGDRVDRHLVTNCEVNEILAWGDRPHPTPRRRSDHLSVKGHSRTLARLQPLLSRLDVCGRALDVRAMIELVAGTADTSAAAWIMTTVRRWIVIEPEAIEHSRATIPMFHDWLALLDGEPVGAGSCSLNLGMEDDTAAFAVACVLPRARGQGVGTAIYRQVSAHARSLGKSELMTWGYEDDAGGVAFAERYSFIIVTRKPALRMALDSCPRPSVDLPEGIEITTLAESPELAEGVWETASEAMPDIPYYSIPMSAGSLEEFVARSFAGPKFIPEATFIAVREGEVIAYAQLAWMSRAAGVADHAMLAVRRAWRGRGIAKALKAQQIVWALDNGLTELRTGNDERNASARAVNAAFAYTPLPDQVGYRGPLLTSD